MNKADLVFTTSSAIHSEAIKWFTHSMWSHVMIATGKGSEVISADAAGVCAREMEPGETEHHAVLHCPKLKKKQAAEIVRAAASMIGREYDFFGAFVGIPMGISTIQDSAAWFCSELVFWAYLKGGVVLLERLQIQMVTPQHIWISPILQRRF